MRSKKGALFHWIVFGLLLAVGSFALMSYTSQIGMQTKGEWQISFLRDYYQGAEKQLLQVQQTALLAGGDMAIMLSQQAGFSKESPCGSYDGVQYWNNEKKFCFLNVDEEINAAFKDIFVMKYGGDEYYLVSRQGEELIGSATGDIVVYNGLVTKYTVKPHFRVDMNYNFDDYFLLQNEAHAIVEKCKWQEKLEECITEMKPANWRFNDCDEDKYREEDRKVVFCAESPGEYSLFDGEKDVPVRYRFGLDFVTPPLNPALLV
ncbi:MAG: hypothetical protein AABX05_03565 [Nanoarchaeota archaeon]